MLEGGTPASGENDVFHYTALQVDVAGWRAACVVVQVNRKRWLRIRVRDTRHLGWAAALLRNGQSTIDNTYGICGTGALALC